MVVLASIENLDNPLLAEWWGISSLHSHSADDEEFGMSVDELNQSIYKTLKAVSR